MLDTQDHGIGGITKPHRILSHGAQHVLEIGGRGRNHPQNLTRRGLLLHTLCLARLGLCQTLPKQRVLSLERRKGWFGLKGHVDRTGISKAKVEPRPSVDSTQMRPPCSSTIRLAMLNPSPVPPFSRVLDVSACWNSSKMRACWSGVMPGPVSRTRTQNRSAPSSSRSSEIAALMTTSPWSVNLMALPTRFRMTCTSRRSSP